MKSINLCLDLLRFNHRKKSHSKNDVFLVNCMKTLFFF